MGKFTASRFVCYGDGSGEFLIAPMKIESNARKSVPKQCLKRARVVTSAEEKKEHQKK